MVLVAYSAVIMCHTRITDGSSVETGAVGTQVLDTQLEVYHGCGVYNNDIVGDTCDTKFTGYHHFNIELKTIGTYNVAGSVWATSNSSRIFIIAVW